MSEQTFNREKRTMRVVLITATMVVELPSADTKSMALLATGIHMGSRIGHRIELAGLCVVTLSFQKRYLSWQFR